MFTDDIESVSSSQRASLALCKPHKTHSTTQALCFFLPPLHLLLFLMRCCANKAPEVWMCKLAGKSGRTFAATRAHVPTPNTMTSYLHVGNRCIPSGFSIAPLPFSIVHTHTHTQIKLSASKSGTMPQQLDKKPSVRITCDTMTSLRSALLKTVTHFIAYWPLVAMKM